MSRDSLRAVVVRSLNFLKLAEKNSGDNKAGMGGSISCRWWCRRTWQDFRLCRSTRRERTVTFVFSIIPQCTPRQPRACLTTKKKMQQQRRGTTDGEGFSSAHPNPMLMNASFARESRRTTGVVRSLILTRGIFRAPRSSCDVFDTTR